MLPKKGWLADFIKYREQTESPEIFNFFAGLSAFSAALRRNISMPFGDEELLPAFYIILVGPPGRVRRTTCTSAAIRLLDAAAVTKVLPQKVTPEALAKCLAENMPVQEWKPDTESVNVKTIMGGGGIVHAGELPVFLGKQQYNVGLIDLLNHLADNAKTYKYTTRTHGQIYVENLAFSLLGACAVNLLHTSIPEVAFAGGFMSRAIFVYEESTDKFFPIPPTPPEEAKKALILGLRKIADIHGQVVLSAKAFENYTHWYRMHRQQRYNSDREADYYVRKPQHVLRLGMCLALNDERMEIQNKDLSMAVEILDYVGRNMERMWAMIGATATGELQISILRILAATTDGFVAKSEIVSKFIRQVSALEVNRALETLDEGNLVKLIVEETGGRPKITVMITPKGKEALNV